ncbi:MAG: putative membrane protein [Arenicella sp.]|jgi:uncharacterized membrane protein
MKTSIKAVTSPGTIFIKGLLFTLPVALTIGILVWVFRVAESLFIQPLTFILPDALHFPGMGALVSIAAIYLVGLAIHGRFLSFIFRWMELAFNKIPVFNIVYRNIREMIDFVSGGKDGELDRVVLVSFDKDVKLIGFVTNPSISLPLQRNDSDEKLNAVYMPMSYQMGGYVLYLPESRLQTLNMSTKEAMQRVLTAEISKSGRATENK